MTNILTAAEAAYFVRTDASDPVMLMLLPMINQIVEKATGRDWTADTIIHPVAKAAAGILLVQYYDNPGQVGDPSQVSSPIGVINLLAQLEAEALKYRKYIFYGVSGAGAIAIDGALVGDDVISLVGVYGVSGDQSANFESEISEAGQLQQTSGSDLSDNIYVVILKSPADDVVP